MQFENAAVSSRLLSVGPSPLPISLMRSLAGCRETASPHRARGIQRQYSGADRGRAWRAPRCAQCLVRCTHAYRHEGVGHVRTSGGSIQASRWPRQ